MLRAASARHSCHTLEQSARVKTARRLRLVEMAANSPANPDFDFHAWPSHWADTDPVLTEGP